MSRSLVRTSAVGITANACGSGRLQACDICGFDRSTNVIYSRSSEPPIRVLISREFLIRKYRPFCRVKIGHTEYQVGFPKSIEKTHKTNEYNARNYQTRRGGRGQHRKDNRSHYRKRLSHSRDENDSSVAETSRRVLRSASRQAFLRGPD